MRVIIAGSRFLCEENLVREAVEASGFAITEVVSGKEPNGIDACGERWADENGIPVKPFPADWKRYGNPAGPIRNEEMAVYAEALIAIPHPTKPSRGTRNMIRRAQQHGLKIYIHKIS